MGAIREKHIAEHAYAQNDREAGKWHNRHLPRAVARPAVEARVRIECVSPADGIVRALENFEGTASAAA